MTNNLIGNEIQYIVFRKGNTHDLEILNMFSLTHKRNTS